ncbi:DUF4376 domain-containing protein [Azospirillum picis]|uniref:DUF4376 domain-containing protein n=1 Tax=Azospirillum picis TaxID=488438 RepID=A0ABU0MNV0_9PROT|nr:DUF4376 domain-containing protein [Azospirillum picis]MBP2301318.1 hypothetical protein [Azospirillum picis]MDQ0535149.1 hypothetical protein [Azospirillum picis]
MAYCKINLETLAVVSGPEDLPPALMGLLPESLVDLGWTDPALGMIGCGYWLTTEEAVELPSALTHQIVADPDRAPLVDEDAKSITMPRKVVPLPADVLAANLAARQGAKVDAINVERDRRLALGVTHGGKTFGTDVLTRTDLGGMATTAALVLAGALDWPDSYAQGWIAMDNSRLPLPAPQDGIALAAAVAGTYSAVVQHARDLMDAALQSNEPEAIDQTLGWPQQAR